MEKRSIAFRLSLYIILAVTTIITLVVYLNYDFSKKILMQNIEEAAVNQSGLIINQVARHIIATQEISRNVAAQAPYYLVNDDLDMFLKGVIKANDIIYGLHAEVVSAEGEEKKFVSVIRSNGDIIESGEQNFCLNYRFPDIIENLGVNGEWSTPFYCGKHDSTLLISYFKSIITPQNKNIGFLSSEISLDFLDDVVSNIEVGERGFSFVVSQSGEYITHPVKEWIMERNIFKVPEKIFENDLGTYISALKEKGSVTGYAYPEILDYEKAWFYAAAIPHTDWLIIIVEPYKDLFKDLDLIFREIIVVSAIGILIILLIIVILFRQMLNPLMKLIRSIQNFSFGDKSKKAKGNELQLLNESLDAFQKQYRLYLKEQTESRKKRKKYEQDLKSAKEIQTSIIPASNPRFSKDKNVELYAELHAAESIGGDLYDYFFIDSKHLLFSMGDVSGKGIPAALFMAVAHTMIKSKATVLSASKIMKLVNDELSKQNVNQHFLTLFIGILNIDTGEVNYCNAAHNYPYVIRDESDVEVLDVAHGLPLGVYANKKYTEDKLTLKEGDSILLYTDGVIDCKDNGDQIYGVERLFGNVNLLLDLRPKEIIKRILKSLWLFKGETKPSDDISLMAVRYLGKNKE